MFEEIKQTWKTITPNSICQKTCTKNTIGTSFTNQWQREIELK